MQSNSFWGGIKKYEFLLSPYALSGCIAVGFASEPI